MDFSSLEFDPTVLDDGEMIWEKYPDLANPIFCKLSEEDFTLGYTYEDLSLLVSFVVLYIDEESPCYKETDMDRRIRFCTNTLKIEEDSMVYDQITNHTAKYSAILYEYFKWSNNIAFEGWFSLKSTMAGYYQYLRTPISNEDADLEVDRRTKIQERLVKLEKTLMEKEAKLFPSPRIQKQIARENLKESLTGYAEKHARYHPALNNE